MGRLACLAVGLVACSAQPSAATSRPSTTRCRVPSRPPVIQGRAGQGPAYSARLSPTRPTQAADPIDAPHGARVVTTRRQPNSLNTWTLGSRPDLTLLTIIDLTRLPSNASIDLSLCRSAGDLNELSAPFVVASNDGSRDRPWGIDSFAR